jgi:hypothetical protein
MPFGNPDGGAPKCGSLADCRPDGSTTGYYYMACLHGACSVDPCITDSDCASGQICACQGQLGGGPPRLGNACMTTQCQVDANCGGGQVCSASVGPCGSLLGYYCHTPADECLTDADCCGTTPLCTFQTSKGHWACQTSTMICPG